MPFEELNIIAADRHTADHFQKVMMRAVAMFFRGLALFTQIIVEAIEAFVSIRSDGLRARIAPRRSGVITVMLFAVSGEENFQEIV